VVLSFTLYNYLYIDYIIVIRHSDDVHKSDRNMLMKNYNMSLNILINVHSLVCHVSVLQKNIDFPAED
jgi:hypothetical protein